MYAYRTATPVNNINLSFTKLSYRISYFDLVAFSRVSVVHHCVLSFTPDNPEKFMFPTKVSFTCVRVYLIIFSITILKNFCKFLLSSTSIKSYYLVVLRLVHKKTTRNHINFLRKVSRSFFTANYNAMVQITVL